MINGLVKLLQRLAGTDSIDDIIRARLLPDEQIVMIDGPAQVSYFFSRVGTIVLLTVALLVAFFTISIPVTGGAVVVAALAASRLTGGAIKQHYVRYVVTTTRIIYMEGVFNRSHQWIPWAKVTDLSSERTVADRIQNIGRVRIDSANEDSAFKEMKNLTSPETMMRVLVYMVGQRQGSVKVPKDIHAILGVSGPEAVTEPPSGGDDVVDGRLAPGTVTVPRPVQGEESRPSRANPVQDVGEGDAASHPNDDPALFD